MNPNPTKNIDYVKKWGQRALRDGYTQLPNVLLRNLADFDLKPNEFMVVMCIMSHQPGRPLASSTVAKATNLSVHTVRNALRHLSKLKYIHRIYHKGDANTYSCNGLYRAVAAYTKNGQTSNQNMDMGVSRIAPYPMQIMETNKEEKNNKNKEESGYASFKATGEHIRSRAIKRK